MEVLEAGTGLEQDWEGRPVRRDLDDSPKAARRLMQSKGEAELRSVLADGCRWTGCGGGGGAGNFLWVSEV
jgi:hypothetical protein